MSAALPCVLALAWAAVDGYRHGRVRAALAARPAPPRAAPLDVLQAIRGGDPTLADSLAENLATLGGAGHLCHWLLDEDDPAGRAAAREAAARHPELAPRLHLFGACPPGVNPKLFKLEGAWRGCTREVLVVLDDDACLPRASLDALVVALAPESGLPAAELRVATALPAYRAGTGLGSRLLAAFVNDHAATTYLAWVASRPAVTLNGMAWAMRVEGVRALGGFAALLPSLTDDLALARAVRARGGAIAQLSVPVWMRTELADLGAWFRQMHRWMLFARLLWRAQPLEVRVALVGLQVVPVLLPLATLTAVLAAPSASSAGAFAAAFALHLGLARDARRRAAGSAAPFTPLLSLAVAVLQPLFLAWAALDPTLRWRDRRYRVRANERFEAL